MGRIILQLVCLLLSLPLLPACEMQSVQDQKDPVVNPKFVGHSRFNQETKKYEIVVTWQGLGELSYEIHRKTIESDPYNYGGGGVRISGASHVHTSISSGKVFVDENVEARMIYEYELLDSETRTFRVGPIRVYVYADVTLTESLTDHLVIGGEDNQYGNLTVRGSVRVENWYDVFAKQLVFQEGANLIFGYHPPDKKWETVPKKDACIVRRIFAQRARGEVLLTGVDSACVADGKTYQGNSFFIQIAEESPAKFVYGEGVNSKDLPPFAQCIMIGERKLLWQERCEPFLPKKAQQR